MQTFLSNAQNFVRRKRWTLFNFKKVDEYAAAETAAPQPAKRIVFKVLVVGTEGINRSTFLARSLAGKELQFFLKKV